MTWTLVLRAAPKGPNSHSLNAEIPPPKQTRETSLSIIHPPPVYALPTQNHDSMPVNPENREFSPKRRSILPCQPSTSVSRRWPDRLARLSVRLSGSKRCPITPRSRSTHPVGVPPSAEFPSGNPSFWGPAWGPIGHFSAPNASTPKSRKPR